MWYDGLMLAIVAYTTIRGASKGMAWQVAAIAALVLCFLFATPLSLVVAPAIRLDPPLNRWVAMLAIYLAFSFGCFAVARMLRGWLEALKFQEYDRHLGALFGALKGVLLCLVVTFFTVCLSETACDYVMHTRSGHIAGELLDHLTLVMPAELQAVLRPYLRHFDDDHRLADGDSTPSHENDRDDADFRGSFQDVPVSANDGQTDRPGFGGLADRIEDKLTDGVRNLIRDALTPRQADPEPVKTRPPASELESDAGTAAGAPDQLDELVREVSELLTSDPDRRWRIWTEIDALMHGVPPGVAARVLEDWRSDLRGDLRDPDLDTDVATPIDGRILRQISAARIRLESLPRPLQERLRQAGSE